MYYYKLSNFSIHFGSLLLIVRSFKLEMSITQKQKRILVEFISSHKKTFSLHHKNRFQREMKWNDLTEILNKNGPPSKDTNKWKKVCIK